MSAIGGSYAGGYQKIDTKTLTDEQKNDLKIHDTGATNDNVLDLSTPDKAIAELTSQDHFKIKFIKIGENEYLKLDPTNIKNIDKIIEDLSKSTHNLGNNFLVDFQESTGIVIRPMSETEAENKALVNDLKSSDPKIVMAALNNLDPDNLPPEILQNKELLAKVIKNVLNDPSKKGCNNNDLCQILFKLDIPDAKDLAFKQLKESNLDGPEKLKLLNFLKDKIPPAELTKISLAVLTSSTPTGTPDEHKELANNLKNLISETLKNASLSDQIEILNQLSDTLKGIPLTDELKTFSRELKKAADITPEKVLAEVAKGNVTNAGELADKYSKLLPSDEKAKFISSILQNLNPDDKNMAAFAKELLLNDNMSSLNSLTSNFMAGKMDSKSRDNLVKLMTTELSDPSISPAKKLQVFQALENVALDKYLVSPEVRANFIKTMVEAAAKPENAALRKYMAAELTQAMQSSESLLKSGPSVEGVATIMARGTDPADKKMAIEFRTAKAEALTKKLTDITGNNNVPENLADKLHELLEYRKLDLTPEGRAKLNQDLENCRKAINDYMDKTEPEARNLMDYIKDPEVAETLAASDDANRITSLLSDVYDSVSKSKPPLDKEVIELFSNELEDGKKSGNALIKSFMNLEPGEKYEKTGIYADLVNGAPESMTKKLKLIGEIMHAVAPEKLEGLKGFMEHMEEKVEYLEKTNPMKGVKLGITAAMGPIRIYACMTAKDKMTLKNMIEGGAGLKDIAEFIATAFSKSKAGAVAGTLVKFAGPPLELAKSLIDMNEEAKKGHTDLVYANSFIAAGAAMELYGLGADATGIGIPAGLLMHLTGAISMGVGVTMNLTAPGELKRQAAIDGYV